MIPFQLVCVRSSTAWDGPTGGSLALSTTTVMVWLPGVIALVTSKTCGALSVSSQPQNVSSTHTGTFFVRSKSSAMRLPAQVSGIVA